MSFVEEFTETGWLQIGGLFSLDLIDGLRNEVESQLGELVTHKGGHRGYIRVGAARVMLSVKLQGPLLSPEIYGHPLLLTVLRQLLGENLVIDSFTCVLAMPGAADQEVHRDRDSLFPAQPDVEAHLPPYAVTVVTPLMDLTPATGTTELFPGTHHGGEANGSELPYVDRGGCFLFDYRLLHHGTANKSDYVRPVLYVSYARPWFTDVRNFRRQARINIDPADLQRIPREHWPLFRRLAGKGSVDLSEKELFPQD
jgi:hypothetical protein